MFEFIRIIPQTENKNSANLCTSVSLPTSGFLDVADKNNQVKPSPVYGVLQ